MGNINRNDNDNINNDNERLINQVEGRNNQNANQNLDDVQENFFNQFQLLEENQNNDEVEENEEENIIVGEDMFGLYIKEYTYDESIKHIRNPTLLLKESLTLELDSISRTKYFIKFNYDSLLDFNCFISFKVNKNTSKKNLSKFVNISPEKYELAYTPHPNFPTKIFKNLPRGENMKFTDENAFIDIDEFNMERNDDNKKEYDLSIEMVPILEKNSDDFKNKNEIVFVNLCNLFVHNGHYEIRTMKQEFKSLGLWFNLFDVFDSSNEGTCLICYNNKCNTIILPCKHSFACVKCANHIKNNEKKCPICKNEFDDVFIINFN